MKKTAISTIIAIVILLLSAASVQPLHAGQRFLVTLSGNYMMPSDDGYRDIYGDGKLYPEIKAGYHIYRDIYLWAGYGYLPSAGTTRSTLDLDADFTQNYLFFGAGYSPNLSRKVKLKLELALLNVQYKEEAMAAEITGSALGFRIDGGGIIQLGKTVFTEFTVGYMNASETTAWQSITFGGIKTGIGLGFRF